MQQVIGIALREKCSYAEFFWSVFSDFQTPNTDTFHAVKKARFLLLFFKYTLRLILISLPKVDYFVTRNASIYLIYVNSENTRTICEIRPKLTVKTPDRCFYVALNHLRPVFHPIQILSGVLLKKLSQKHPSRGVLRCSENMLCNFTETTLRHGCSPVNLLRIFRTTFSKNASRRLLLSSWKTFSRNNSLTFLLTGFNSVLQQSRDSSLYLERFYLKHSTKSNTLFRSILFLINFIHYSPVLLIYTPWKHQKTKGFLKFSGVIDKQHQAVME